MTASILVNNLTDLFVSVMAFKL